MEVKDCNGSLLEVGDNVSIIQNIKVKGGSDLKKGEKIKNIRLYDEDNIEGKPKGQGITIIKTIYVKKDKKKK